MLESDGYTVTSALGNDQGIALAATVQFDVVVVGFSGANDVRSNMVRWLKQNVPLVPVVALLASSADAVPDADCETFSENPRVWLDTVQTAAVKR